MCLSISQALSSVETPLVTNVVVHITKERGTRYVRESMCKTNRVVNVPGRRKLQTLSVTRFEEGLCVGSHIIFIEA